MSTLFESLRKFNKAVAEKGVNDEIKHALQQITLTQRARDVFASTIRALEFMALLIMETDKADLELLPEAVERFMEEKNT